MQLLENTFSNTSDHSKRRKKALLINFHSGRWKCLSFYNVRDKNLESVTKQILYFCWHCFCLLVCFSAWRKLITKIIMRSTISCQLHGQNFGMFLPPEEKKKLSHAKARNNVPLTAMETKDTAVWKQSKMEEIKEYKILWERNYSVIVITKQVRTDVSTENGMEGKPHV